MTQTRIVQVYYIDELGVKRITDRIRTAQPLMDVLKARNHTIYDHEAQKRIITPGYEVEELPLPTEQ